MVVTILFFSVIIFVCLLGIIQDFFREKEGAGFFTFVGCVLGLWLSIMFLIRESDNNEPKTPIKQTTIKQDTIPINIKIIVENEQS